MNKNQATQTIRALEEKVTRLENDVMILAEHMNCMLQSLPTEFQAVYNHQRALLERRKNENTAEPNLENGPQENQEEDNGQGTPNVDQGGETPPGTPPAPQAPGVPPGQTPDSQPPGGTQS